MTIVEKLRKLITTKGGDPTGVMTIAEGVDRLEKTEEGGGGGSGGPEAVYLYIAPSIEYSTDIGGLALYSNEIYADPDLTERIYEVEVLYDLGIIGDGLTPKALYLVDVNYKSLFPTTVHMTYNENADGFLSPTFSTMPIHRKFYDPDHPEGYETTYQLYGMVVVDTETGASVLILSINELNN